MGDKLDKEKGWYVLLSTTSPSLYPNLLCKAPSMYVRTKVASYLNQEHGDKLDKEKGQYVLLSTTSPSIYPDLFT